MQISRPIKILPVILALFIFVNNALLAAAYEANIWSERKKNIRVENSLPAFTLPSLSETIDKNTLFPFGRLHQTSPEPSSKNKLTVLHIQDIHMNAEAQYNIASVIERLMDNHSIRAIALEGDWRPINLERFRRFHRPDLIRAVSRYLLENNKITGPIFSALTGTAEPPRIFGVDDPVHYRANVAAYRRAAPLMTKTAEVLSAEQRKWEDRKLQVLNPRLLAFHEKVLSYRRKKITLRTYLHKIASDSQKLPPSIESFLAALDLEAGLKLSEVERERSTLLQELIPRLTKQESAGLLRLGTLCGLGQEPLTNFYDRLLRHGSQFNISSTRFPNLTAYARYVRLAHNLTVADVVSDLSKFEHRLYAVHTESKEEAMWVARFQWLELASKLVDFSMNKEEWEEYKNLITENCELKTENFKSFEDFYKEAEIRDGLMAENLIKAVKLEPSTGGVVVLVTGGFHSKGIDGRLKAEGISVNTFTPKISHIDTASGSRYLNVFLQDHTPLDKLFKGDRLFLTFPPTRGIRELPPAVSALSGEEDDFKALSPRNSTVRCDSTSRTPPNLFESHAGGVVTQVAFDGKTVSDIRYSDYESRVISWRHAFFYRIAFWVLLVGMCFVVSGCSGIFPQEQGRFYSTGQKAFRRYAIWLAPILAVVFMFLIAGIFHRKPSLKPPQKPLPLEPIDDSYIFQQMAERVRVSSLDELKALVESVSRKNALQPDRSKHQAVIFLQAFGESEPTFPATVGLVPSESQIDDFVSPLTAIHDLFAMQSRAGVLEGDKWKTFFRIVEDGSTAVYALYFPGQKKPHILNGEFPSLEDLKRASTVVVFNAAQTQRSTAAGQSEVEGVDTMRLVYTGRHKKWWIVAKQHAFFPPDKRKENPVESWPLHSLVTPAETGEHQSEIGSLENLEDLFGLLIKVNGTGVDSTKESCHVLADLAAKTIQQITDKGDSFKVLIAPGANHQGHDFRISMNGWKSSPQSGVEMFRFPHPIERARKKSIFESSGVRVSYLEPRFHVTLFGREIWVYNPLAVALLTCSAAVLRVFYSRLTWIQKEVTGFILETPELRVFIGDRVVDTAEPHFLSEWSRVINGDKATRIFKLRDEQTHHYEDSGNDSEERVAWLRSQIQSGQLTTFRPDLLSKYEKARSLVSARWEDMQKIARALKKSLHQTPPKEKKVANGLPWFHWSRFRRLGAWRFRLYYYYCVTREHMARGLNVSPIVHGFALKSSLELPTDGSPMSPIHENRAGKEVRTADEVRLYLERARAQDQEVSVEGSYPLFDGATSVWDIRSYRDMLFPGNSRWIFDLANVVTPAAGNIGIKLRFEPSEDPTAIEYVHPQRGLRRFSGPVEWSPNGRRLKNRSDDALPYILSNIFGIDKGVRIIFESTAAMPDWGGMEGGGMFYMHLIAGISVLVGADLSMADIYHLSVKLENDEFGGITGGRGQLGAILGGVYQHIWIKVDGKDVPFSIPLFPKDEEQKRAKEIEDHVVLVQAGITYKDGKPNVNRSAPLINQMWLDLLLHNVKMELFHEMRRLAVLYTDAMRKGNYSVIVQTMIRYVEIRDELCREWMRVLVHGKDPSAKPWVRDVHARVFNKDSTDYVNYKIIRDLYQQLGEEEFVKTSLYTYGKIGALVERAKKRGIAVMPTGAGGPNSNLLGASEGGWISGDMEAFLKSEGLELYDQPRIEQAMKDGREIRVYSPVKVGFSPMKFHGLNLTDLNMRVPWGPQDGFYNQVNGQFMPSGESHEENNHVNVETKQRNQWKARARQFGAAIRLLESGDQPITPGLVEGVVGRVSTLSLSEAVQGPLSECVNHPEFLEQIQGDLKQDPKLGTRYTDQDLFMILMEMELKDLPNHALAPDSNVNPQGRTLVMPINNERQLPLVKQLLAAHKSQNVLLLISNETRSYFADKLKSPIAKGRVLMEPLGDNLIQGKIVHLHNLKSSLPEAYRDKMAELSLVLQKGMVIKCEGISKSTELLGLLFLFLEESRPKAKATLMTYEQFENLKTLLHIMRAA